MCLWVLYPATVHSGARGVFVAVAVSVGDRGKVTCDM